MRVNLTDPDKAGHYVAGSLCAAAGAALAILAGYAALAWAAALGTAFAAGLYKEARDWWRNRQARRRGESEPAHVEREDLLATALAGLPVAAPLLVATIVAMGAAFHG